MQQRDYILRLIEQLGEFLAAIFTYLRKGYYKKASEAIEDAYYKLLEKEASEFININDNELISALENEHQFNQQQLEVLAELFYAEAELQYLQNNKDASKIFYQKSLIIFEFLEKEQKSFSFERQEKLSKIKIRISEN